MNSIFARKALLHKSWAENVRFSLQSIARQAYGDPVDQDGSRAAFAAALERLGTLQ